MANKSVQGNEKLAKAIKMRRNELDLTIEEAARRAGVGTKTWCRYEAGESIRKDKYKGVCKALNWRGFLDAEIESDTLSIINEYKEHEAWSKYIADNFGDGAAASFAIGSDILLDYVKDDMAELKKMPKGTHIGQINISYVEYELPQQFYVNYDYDFMYAMYITIIHFREMANRGTEIIAHTVLEELVLYLIMEESRTLLEDNDCEESDGWEDWVFDIFGDMDIITCLYSNEYLTEDCIYHFKYWMKNQFYCEK